MDKKINKYDLYRTEILWRDDDHWIVEKFGFYRGFKDWIAKTLSCRSAMVVFSENVSSGQKYGWKDVYGKKHLFDIKDDGAIIVTKSVSCDENLLGRIPGATPFFIDEHSATILLLSKKVIDYAPKEVANAIRYPVKIRKT